MARQQANSALMPGQKAAESQINQNAANSASALMQSGTGASGILAGLSKLNQGTNQATNQLASQSAGYQSQQKDRLSNVLRQDAAWQQQDLQNAQKEKAALKQAAATNIFGGLSSAAGTAIYGHGGGFKKDPITNTSPYVEELAARPVNLFANDLGGQVNPTPPIYNPFYKLNPAYIR